MQVNNLQLNRFENRPTTSNITRPVTGAISKFEKSVGNNVSFKGTNRLYGAAINGLAKGLGKLVDTKFTRTTVKFLNGESENRFARAIGKAINVKQKWFQHAIALESVYLTSFYMYNTKKSKSIPEDQKKPMMINQALVTTLCTALGYTVDSKISKFFEKVKLVYTSTNLLNTVEKMKPQVEVAKRAAKTAGAVDAAIKTPLKVVNAIGNGIPKIKSVLVFGFIYRYFAPVFITPIANRISEYFDKKDSKNLKQNTNISSKKPTLPLTVNFASTKTNQVK